jgi:hypothetical protein
MSMKKGNERVEKTESGKINSQPPNSRAMRKIGVVEVEAQRALSSDRPSSKIGRNGRQRTSGSKKSCRRRGEVVGMEWHGRNWREIGERR